MSGRGTWLKHETYSPEGSISSVRAIASAALAPCSPSFEGRRDAGPFVPQTAGSPCGSRRPAAQGEIETADLCTGRGPTGGR